MKNFFNTLKYCILVIIFLLATHASAGYRYLRLTAMGGVSTNDIFFEEIDWMVGTTAYLLRISNNGNIANEKFIIE